MPLSMVYPGENVIIIECRVKEATRKFLEGLGIIPGTEVSVIAETGGDLILNIKGSRIAINKGIAQGITVENNVQHGRHRYRHMNKQRRRGRCMC